MDHPVLKNLSSFSIYLGIWVLIGGIHFAVLYFLYAFPLNIAAGDSLIFNFIFSLIGISIWYVVRYSSPGRKSMLNFLFNHLASVTILLLFWFGVSYMILNMLFGYVPAYRQFLVNSIPYRLIIGFTIYALIGMAYYLFIFYTNLQEKMKLEVRLNELLKESELNMLKSQINPHFLFNSLNSISSLTITNPEKAREMVIKLSDFLRYSVATNASSFTTLEKEMANIQRYLEIEKVRFGDKLVFSFKLEGSCKDHIIPVMLLQPLFENAIKHGVYESTERVEIEMDCEFKSGFLEIRIVNDFDPNAHGRKGSGLGLKNIRERMRLLYQDKNLLKTTILDKRFEVKLSIPVNKS